MNGGAIVAPFEAPRQGAHDHDMATRQLSNTESDLVQNHSPVDPRCFAVQTNAQAAAKGRYLERPSHVFQRESMPASVPAHIDTSQSNFDHRQIREAFFHELSQQARGPTTGFNYGMLLLWC